MWCQQLLQKKEVNTNSEAKQTNILGNKEPLKTDKTKNLGDNTNEDDGETSKKKLKDISKIQTMKLMDKAEQ